MPRIRTQPTLLRVAVAAASLLLFVVAARAEESAGKALLERLKNLQREADDGGLASAIDEVPSVYKSEGAAPVQAKLRGALGKIAKDKKLDSARSAAVRALCELDDAKNAWKEMSKLLPSPKVAEGSGLDLEVVRAAGQLAQSKAAKPLLELVKKGKDPKLAAAAARALGGFTADVKGRVKILEELVSLGKRLRPGQSTDKAAGSAATERWAAVGPAITEGLNELTGRSEKDFEAWEALVEEHKRNLKGLFPET